MNKKQRTKANKARKLARGVVKKTFRGYHTKSTSGGVRKGMSKRTACPADMGISCDNTAKPVAGGFSHTRTTKMTLIDK